jgi:hypothetical protein
MIASVRPNSEQMIEAGRFSYVGARPNPIVSDRLLIG